MKVADGPEMTHPTAEQRVAAGKAARTAIPRRSHASWDPPADRADPVSLLESQAASRVEELLPIRYARMLTSPFAFFRGGAAIMAADLAAGPQSGIEVQLCGDAHLGNFGGFASPDRSVVFSINDFDETLPGPWEWDVKRLAASTVVAGRERGFTDKECNSIAMSTVGRYRAAMSGFAAQRDLEVWYARMDVAAMLSRWRAETSAKTVRAVGLSVDKARTHDSLAAFAKLTHEVDGETRIVSDPPTIVPIEEMLPDASPADVAEIFDHNFGLYTQSLAGDRRRLLERFRFVHLARKVVGVGSVGTRAWIVLLIGRDRQDPLFLQVKEAPGSALEPFLGPGEFDNQGQRVVEGQRLMQAASEHLLGWFRTQGIEDGVTRDFYVRQLWDWKLSAHIEHMSPEAMRVYGSACGWTLARAHARSGDRIAIAAYLGAKPAFETAIAEFAHRYADQNERDHAALVEAVKTGRLIAKEA